MLSKIYTNDYPYTKYLMACAMSYILFRILAEPMSAEHFPKSIGLEIEDLILTLIVCSFIFYTTNHKIYDAITMYQYVIIFMTPLIWGTSSKFEVLQKDLNSLIKSIPFIIISSILFVIISTFVVYDAYSSGKHVDLMLTLTVSILCLVSMYYGKHSKEVLHLHHQWLFFIFAILLNSKNDIIRVLHAVCVGSVIHGISAYRFAQNIEHKKLSDSHYKHMNKYKL